MTSHSVEREIEALLAAKTEQIPRWHDFVMHGERQLSVADHIDLLHRLLGIQLELILRLARELDVLGGG